MARDIIDPWGGSDGFTSWTSEFDNSGFSSRSIIDPWAEEEDTDRSFGQIASDTGLNLLSGAIALPEGIVGLADLVVTNSMPYKALEYAGFDDLPTITKTLADNGVDFAGARKIISESYLSDELQQQNRNVTEAFDRSFLEGVKSVYDNPGVAFSATVESLPQMLGTVGATKKVASNIFESAYKEAIERGATAAAAETAASAAVTASTGQLLTAGAAAEGALSAGLTAAEFAGDGELTTRESIGAAGAGLATAVFGRIGGALGNRLGLGDIEADIAQQAFAGRVTNPIRSTLGGAVQEGFLEELPQSVGEQIASNYGADRELTEGLGQAATLGAVSGAGMGGAFGAYRGLMGQPSLPDVGSEPGDLQRNFSARQDQINQLTQEGLTPEYVITEMQNQLTADVTAASTRFPLFEFNLNIQNAINEAAASGGDNLDIANAGAAAASASASALDLGNARRSGPASNINRQFNPDRSAADAVLLNEREQRQADALGDTDAANDVFAEGVQLRMAQSLYQQAAEQEQRGVAEQNEGLLQLAARNRARANNIMQQDAGRRAAFNEPVQQPEPEQPAQQDPFLLEDRRPPPLEGIVMPPERTYEDVSGRSVGQTIEEDPIDVVRRREADAPRGLPDRRFDMGSPAPEPEFPSERAARGGNDSSPVMEARQRLRDFEPQPEPTLDPEVSYRGATGNGFQTEKGANTALRSRQSAQPEYDWQVVQGQDGAFELFGRLKENERPSVSDPEMATEAATESAVSVSEDVTEDVTDPNDIPFTEDMTPEEYADLVLGGQVDNDLAVTDQSTVQETARQEVAAADLKVKRAEDFRDTGDYDVTLPDGSSLKIFRDTDQFSSPQWYVQRGSGDTTFAGFTRAEALESIAKEYNELSGDGQVEDGRAVTEEDFEDGFDMLDEQADFSTRRNDQPRNTIRLDMNFRDVNKRVPELTQAAQQLRAGEITREQYAQKVNELKPVLPYQGIPEPASDEQIFNAISKDKRDRINAEIDDGTKVGLRLDIPAYTKKGTWVPSIHRTVNGSDSPSYRSTAAVSNAKFPKFSEASLRIAEGTKNKETFARIGGQFINRTAEENVALAQEALNSPDWIQVGMDPERAGYFYDRNDIETRVVSADEVIQIGPLVLAKNAVTETAGDLMFSPKREGQQRRHGIDGQYIVRSQGVVTGKPALVKQINIKNGDKQKQALRDLESRNPDPLSSRSAWLRFERDLLGDNETPAEPSGLIDLYNNINAWAEKHKELTPEQLKAASEGFQAVSDMEQAYANGDATVNTTGKIMLWGMLSRMLSAHPHESAFLDAATDAKLDEFIQRAIDRPWTQEDVDEYLTWAGQTLPEYSPSKSGTSNLNDFGAIFLNKMSRRLESGESALQRLHNLIADTSVPSKDVRAEFYSLGEGLGIQNKVLSFVMLMTGRKDVVVMDRIQINSMMDADNRYGKKIYDDVVSLFEGAHGLARYEAIERSLLKKINDLYVAVGRPQDASIGRYHWESWVRDSGQVVAHPTMKGLVRETINDQALAESYSDLGAPEGRFHRFAFGSVYARDKTGKPYMMYPDLNGDVYRFSLDQFKDFIDHIKNPKNGVVPYDFSVQSFYDKGYPWFEDEGVDREVLNESIKRFAERKIDPAELLSQDGLDAAQAAVTGRRSQERLNESDGDRKQRLIRAYYIRQRLSLAGDESLQSHREGSNGRYRGIRGLKHTPTAAYTKNLERASLAAPKLVEFQKDKETERQSPEAVAAFQEAITNAKQSNPFGAAVYVYPQQTTPDETGYEDMRLFITPDGSGGFAIKDDGDIVSVFNTAGGGAVYSMLDLAVSKGGTKLDAFDTVLPHIYANAGFKVKRRIPWDDQYMPEGWDKNLFSQFNNGEPDVVFMEYDPAYDPNVKTANDDDVNLSPRRAPQPTSVDTALGRIRDALAGREGQALDDAGITVVMPDAVPRERRGSLAFAVQAARAFQKSDVVNFVEFAEGVGGFNGATVGGQIFIDVNAEQPYHIVLGHELTHVLKRDYPDLYQQLEDMIIPQATAREDSARQHGFDMDSEKGREEYVSDVVGNRFGETEFWRAMADANPKGFRVIAQVARSLMTKLADFFRMRSINSGDGVKDLNRVRSEIAKVMNEYRNRLNEDAQGQIADDQIPSFMRTEETMLSPRRNPPQQNEFAQENRRIREQDVTLWDKVKREAKKQLAPGGLLPAPVFDAKIDRDNKLAATEFDTVYYVNKLERAVKQSMGRPFEKLSQAQRIQIQESLTGNMDRSLPQPVQEAITGMRQNVDQLSAKYVSILNQQSQEMLQDFTGADRDILNAYQEARITGDQQVLDDAKAAYMGENLGRTMEKVAQYVAKTDLMDTIQSNVGRYVHRSYQAFDDPKWFSRVPDAVLNNARDYLVNRMEQAGVASPEALDRAEVIINDILKEGTAYGSIEAFIKESKLGSKDLSILQRRKDIAPEIRALMGEYEDARVNYAKTTSKMARLIYNTRFLDRVKSVGMGEFLFTEDNRPPNMTKIAAEGNKAIEPLNGLYAPRDVAEAFADMGKSNWGPLIESIIRVNGLVKYGKTVLSPTTQFRNFMSAAFFAISNGHFDVTKTAKSVSVMREYFSKSGDAGKLAYLRKLKDLGVVYDTPYAGEMMRLLEDSKMLDLESQESDGAFKSNVKRAANMATRFYQFGDDFWKIVGFENEKQNLVDSGMNVVDAEREAASRIRNTYPTYSMVGRGVNTLRRFPLAGTFVSFPAEIIRTSYNMIKIATEDMKNPARRSMGVKRLAGIAFTSGLMYGIQAITKEMFDVDDDEEEAIKQMSPYWSENSNLAYAGRDDKGRIRYYDLSFLDPYNYFKRPINAAMRDQPWEDAFVSAARDMMVPFFGTDITAGAMFEVLANKKATGGEIRTSADGLIEQTTDVLEHIGKTVQPGIIGNAQRLTKAAREEITPYGKEYTMEDEVAALFGWRATTFDPKVALSFRAMDIREMSNDASASLSRALSNPNEEGSEGIEQALERSLSMREKAFNQALTLISAARGAGMSDDDIWTTLGGSGISRRELSYLIDEGETPPMRLTASSARNSYNRALRSLGEERANRVLDRYGLAMDMLDDMQQ